MGQVGRVFSKEWVGGSHLELEDTTWKKDQVAGWNIREGPEEFSLGLGYDWGHGYLEPGVPGVCQLSVGKI